MATLRITDLAGATTAVAAKEGLTVMEIIREAGFDELLALCGGCCSCATCHVYVDPGYFGRLPPMSDNENDLLDGTSRRQATSRLSCQLPFGQALDGMAVQIAPEE